MKYMYEVTFIGSISGRASFSKEDVLALLSLENTPLRYGTDFVGRPTTVLFRNETALVKLHTEFDWDVPVMEKWVCRTLDRERESCVHSPDKMWFLVKHIDQKQTCIGNICPLLRPLNQLLSEPPVCDEERAIRLSWFEQLFRMYFTLAKKTGMRLDEGISNFGLDMEGTLFYLDDDMYRWDDLLALPHVIGTWFRTYRWFDKSFSMELGYLVRDILNELEYSSDNAQIIVEHLRGLFMPQAERREILLLFAESLLYGRSEASTPHTILSSTTVSPSPKQRYWAILGDVHANLPALEAVLTFLREEGIEEGIVLGDTVGYGPHPCECIERLAESRLSVIKGNHDHAAATHETKKGFSQLAKWCLEWTIPQLDAIHQGWLSALPSCLEGENWLAVHGAPMDPVFFNGYVYAMTYEDNLEYLAKRNISLCFHGHTHIPIVYARLSNLRDQCFAQNEQNLSGYRHALVCPGSVGQPRNRQVGAQLGLWDRSENTLRFITLTYDVQSTLHAMQEMGFPSELGHRLLTGF